MSGSNAELEGKKQRRPLKSASQTEKMAPTTLQIESHQTKEATEGTEEEPKALSFKHHENITSDPHFIF